MWWLPIDAVLQCVGSGGVMVMVGGASIRVTVCVVCLFSISLRHRMGNQVASAKVSTGS